MKIIHFISILLICFSPQANLLAQKRELHCDLVKKSLEIQECSIKSNTLEKVLDEMISKIEEEKVFGEKIPHQKSLYIEKSPLGYIIEVFTSDNYSYLKDNTNIDSVSFFSYKNIQFLVRKMNEDIFKEFFVEKEKKGMYVTYIFINKDNLTCSSPLIIEQNIIYEIREDKFRFQEKTLTHTELYW